MITNEYGLAERQNELLQMMKDVDILLHKNDICYSLCGGSLLGAIRHNGFIPWDDDIDIMVDRTNYDKLLSVFEGEDGDQGYRLTRSLWIYRIQKKNETRTGLTAPTIDVFVMDNCPNNLIQRKLKIILIRTLQGMMHEKVTLKGHTLLNRVCLVLTYIMGLPLTDQFKFNCYDRISQIGNKKSTEFISGYNDLFKAIPLRYKANLMEKMDQHIFEDTEFPIIEQWHSYLKTQYGDYMTPVPVEERKPVHI